MSANNPAGRLLDFTKRAQALGPRTAGRKAWQQVLSDEGEDSLQLNVLLERLACVVILPAAVRREVGLLKDFNQDLYLRHIGVWEDAFASRVSLDAEWSHFTQVFKPEHLFALEVCDDWLMRARPEPTLPPDFLIEITGEIDDLRERVVEGGLDEELTRFLLDGLSRMQRALRQYRFCGIPPVIEALEAAVGAAQLQRDSYDSSKGSALGEEYWSKLSSIYSRVRDEWHPYRALKGVVVDILALPSGPQTRR